MTWPHLLDRSEVTGQRSWVTSHRQGGGKAVTRLDFSCVESRDGSVFYNKITQTTTTHYHQQLYTIIHRSICFFAVTINISMFTFSVFCLCSMCAFSGVARICCEGGQSWKLCHGALTGWLQGRVQQLLDD